MLDKRLAATIISVALVSALTAVAALFPREDTEPQPIYEQVSDIPLYAVQGDVPATDTSGPLYLLREHEGYIGIFSPDGEELLRTLEKLVKHLPEYDRIQMKEGVAVYSEQELVARIEDYTS